jgi:shikimate 5-dehydrogenase
MTRLFTFIGVTTMQSSIMRIFPRWREILRLGDDVEMAGWDLPIHAPPARYRDVVTRLSNDPANLGALVTTHKMDLYEATRDLFDEVDAYARRCNEVSCIARRGERLLGWARDPISAGKSLDSILGDGYFGRTGGEVLCLGAGGSGVAITLHLLTRPDPRDGPRRIVVTDRSAGRLETLRGLHRQLESDVPVTYVHNADPRVNDTLVARLPPASMVINATGMGKDTPGSPVTDDVSFPEQGIAWELNYRGALDFLHQAQAARAARGLHVEDGWDYFIFGWTAAIEEVFQRPIGPDDLEALKRAAAWARPSLAAG